MARSPERTHPRGKGSDGGVESGAHAPPDDLYSSHAYSTNENSPAGDSRASDHSKLRLRKACDSCSIRKVKCDEQGPPCQPCAALDIPCTFERPSRRRGPPNRHAEAIKKRRLGDAHSNDPQVPLSPSNASWELQSLHDAFGSTPSFSAELICPFSLLLPLIDDYFVYIHPLVPIPHEPTFRAQLARREDRRDRTFLAMVAGMIGSLVVSFPRKPRLHLKAQQQDGLFPNYMSFVNRCVRVAVEARGAGFLEKHHTVYDATTSYLLALMGFYSFEFRRSKLYFVECLGILRSLGFHRRPSSGSIDQMSESSGLPQDYDLVNQELSKRLFWVLFVGIRSTQQISGPVPELCLPPETPQEPYPALPLEVDDEYITATQIYPQPSDVTAELVGFNANVRVYLSYSALAGLDMMYGMGPRPDWENQSRIMQQCLVNCKHALDGLPMELFLRPGRSSGDFGSGLRTDGTAGHFEQESESSVGSPTMSKEISAFQKRRLQYEIQKANIYVSQLGTRSYIVERYWDMRETFHKMDRGHAQSGWSDMGSFPPRSADVEMVQSNGHQSDMAAEREAIVDDLLDVLGSISQVNMEPNGASFINKIRQIAATLLDVPSTRQGNLATRARDYLMELVEVLMKLERVPPSKPTQQTDGRSPMDVSSPLTPAPTNAWTEVDEEAELRHWADLREYQSRFAKSGGFLSNL